MWKCTWMQKGTGMMEMNEIHVYNVNCCNNTFSKLHLEFTLSLSLSHFLVVSNFLHTFSSKSYRFTLKFIAFSLLSWIAQCMHKHKCIAHDFKLTHSTHTYFLKTCSFFYPSMCMHWLLQIGFQVDIPFTQKSSGFMIDFWLHSDFDRNRQQKSLIKSAVERPENLCEINQLKRKTL